jgi:hypothetical protein
MIEMAYVIFYLFLFALSVSLSIASWGYAASITELSKEYREKLGKLGWLFDLYAITSVFGSIFFPLVAIYILGWKVFA